MSYPQPTMNPITARISSLLSPESRAELEKQKKRSASNIYQLSALSTSSNVQSFFDKKVTCLEDELATTRCLMNGLTESRVRDLITEDEFQQELRRHLDFFCETRSTTQTLKRQNDFLKEDFEEAVACKRPREGEVDPEFLERAFCDTILPRVMAANAKQDGRDKNAKSRKQHQFRQDVDRYYGVPPDSLSHCQILDKRLDRKLIKAAHIVPKSLTDEEVAHLFNQKEINSMDPRNGKLKTHIKNSLAKITFNRTSAAPNLRAGFRPGGDHHPTCRWWR